MKTLHMSVHYPHPVADVWAAITDPRAIAEWLMPNTFVPAKGARFKFMTDPIWLCDSSTTECEVLEFDPPRRMVWSWHSVPIRAKWSPTMRIEWTLVEEDGGTRLELLQTGMEGLGFLKSLGMKYGWGGMLKDELRKVLRNVKDGVFTPGAVPLAKRYYKARTVPAEFVR